MLAAALRRVLVRASLAAAVASVLAPGSAWAHGLAGPPGVPVPAYLFSWGAAVVLVVSFAGLAFLWPRPRLEHAQARKVVRLPAALGVASGLAGIALFAFVVYCGLDGTEVATRNFTPAFVYIVFWVGLVPLSVALGDVFAAFNPWRAVGRATGYVVARVMPGRIGPPLAYPSWLGRWPAVAGIAAFAWVELAYTDRSVPSTLAVLAIAYATAQLIGMMFFGVETWTRRGDAFAVYFNLFARLSPLEVRDRTLMRRPLLAGATRLEAAAGTVALLCVMIGSTSFDGLSGTTLWRDIAPRLEKDLLDAGLGLSTSVELVATLGLVVMVGLVAGLYSLGIRGMRTIDEHLSTRDLMGRFIHTLIPIAAGYVLAHYFTFLVIQGQSIGALISDPLGHGADLFGTAHATIDYGFVSKSATWYFQVGALLCGHVGGLVLAHDRALVVFPDRRDATRSQQWMLTVMVGFTSLGLWLLASIAR